MRLKLIPLLAISLLLLGSCSLFKGKDRGVSSTTGWAYNDPDNGGFEYQAGYQQETGPGLVPLKEEPSRWDVLSRMLCMIGIIHRDE